jgi:hypothetical protein
MQPRTARRWRFVVFAMVVVTSTIAAACAPPGPTPPPVNSAGLRASMVDGGIELTWTATESGELHGHELQYRDDGDWLPVPTGTVPTATFTDVTPRTLYSFRVRSRVAPGAPPASFSQAVFSWYVEPELPIVRIDTQDAAPILDRENYVRATMSVDPNGSGFAPYSGTLGIRGRGNSTWTLPKKPYRLKLDTKSPMFGIASSRDWALLANAFDRSQVRTSTAEAISKSTRLAWTPSYRHVEVVLNGQYIGVYQFSETVRPASSRVAIDELKSGDNSPPNVTGGYLLEIDSRLEENNEPGWRTPRDVPVVIKEPDPATPQQANYIRGHVEAFEQTLYSPGFADPVNGYRRYLDVDAFIDHYLVQEITRNGDSFWSSTYFYKRRNDDRLVFGPMWDFDRSIGSPVTDRPQPPEGWYARNNGPWIRRLFQDPAFAAQVDARVRELLPTLSGLPAQMESLADSLGPAIRNDELRWYYTAGAADQPSYIRNWLDTRLAWMEANTPAAP